MFKIVGADSWPNAPHESVDMIKVAKNGLKGRDRQDLLSKRAAAEGLLHALDQIELKPGDVPMHVISVHETEKYGCNKNGDAFSRETCKTAHHTFKDHARYYRLHENKNPVKSYGKVAATSYNPDMGRIELLVIGNGTKEAADHNGGLPMLQSSLDTLENRGHLDWSMGCKVAYDVCSICGNKAATRADYCDSNTCVNPRTGDSMPGCKTGLTKIASDGTRQYVENPNPTFNDISEIPAPESPADMNARGWRLRELEKVASTHVMGGAELAEKLGFSLDMGEQGFGDIGEVQDVIRKLAEYELGDFHKSAQAKAWSFIKEAMQDECLGRAVSVQAPDFREKLSGLTDLGIFVSEENFVRMHHPSMTEDEVMKTAATIRVVESNKPYSKILMSEDILPNISNALKKYAGARYSDTEWARQFRSESVFRNNLQKKAASSMLSSPNRETTLAPLGSSMAVDYILYKAAALRQLQNRSEFEHLCQYASVHAAPFTGA